MLSVLHRTSRSTFFHSTRTNTQTQTHTHPFNGPLSGTIPGWAGTRKVKPIWILLEQQTVSGTGISWAICKSAPCSRQITMPAPHHSVYYRPDALPAAKPTASKHWRQFHSTRNPSKIEDEQKALPTNDWSAAKHDHQHSTMTTWSFLHRCHSFDYKMYSHRLVCCAVSLECLSNQRLQSIWE